MGGEKLNGAFVTGVEPAAVAVVEDGKVKEKAGLEAAVVVAADEAEGVVVVDVASEEANEEKLKLGVAADVGAVAAGIPNKDPFEGVVVAPKEIPLPKSGVVAEGVDAGGAAADDGVVAGIPNLMPVAPPDAGVVAKVNPVEAAGVVAVVAVVWATATPNLNWLEGVEAAGPAGGAVPGFRVSQATHLVVSDVLLT